MLEQIAIALSQETYLGGQATPWEERDEKHQDWCRRMARAAVKTMFQTILDEKQET
jgi:hypothetical protein